MRHNKESRRFSRPSGHLRCMMANLTNSLLQHGRVKTTVPKSKELRRCAERMITLGKAGTLASRRRAMAFLRSKETVTRLFVEIAPEYRARNGGYTRIYKIGPRPGDCAPMSIIELVEGDAALAGAAAEEKGGAKKPAKKAVAKKTAKKPPVKAKAAGKTAGKTEKKPAAKKTAKKTAKKEE